jgi:PBP1b-binding outer membrane lipoprotein LpoB
VIVGLVGNKSNEHISTETFVKDLERELTNSGQVRFVASKEQREEVREERTDQAKNASVKTAKSMGQEYGADFMLKGQINTIDDQAGKQQLKYYQVELEMIDLLTNEKVWIGQKKIKKPSFTRNANFDGSGGNPLHARPFSPRRRRSGSGWVRLHAHPA